MERSLKMSWTDFLFKAWQAWCRFVGPAGPLYEVEYCPKCFWAGLPKDLTADGACPQCFLVLPDARPIENVVDIRSRYK